MKLKLSHGTFLVSGILLNSCNYSNPDEPPNILWLSAEDISPVFGCYDDPEASTPNIDRLAGDGIVYTRAYATAPICSPARSCLITGIHATSLGTQHLRSEIPVPDSLEILPEILRKSGYYCTNNSKTDYNFSPEGRWDENSGEAHWKNRPDGEPFFAVFNYGITHEGNTNKFEEGNVKALKNYHDPLKANLPPYIPDTEEMRIIWAHAYDLISDFDMIVGKHIAELEEAGELENTVIFIFGDHGWGLPRHKRWLTNSGLRVPLVIYVPEKYQKLFPSKRGEKDDHLVSFSDFAPTVLSLAGTTPPGRMHGIAFAGKNTASREFVYGARSRADDVYDIARSISDGRYIYIKHFMPHQPYIQNAIIFGDDKRGFRELRRVKNEGMLTDAPGLFWMPKPNEELYDLVADPFEMNNLADDKNYADLKNQFSGKLFKHILSVRDIGFLNESEMMIQSVGSSPYELAQNNEKYPLEEILETAWDVGNSSLSSEMLIQRLQDPVNAIRYWGVITVAAGFDPDNEKIIENLIRLTSDESPAVAIAASEILLRNGIGKDKSLDCLVKYLKDPREWVVLNSAISLRRIGRAAVPVLPVVKEEVQKYHGNVGGGYSSWLYPMFIGFALDQVILNCD